MAENRQNQNTTGSLSQLESLTDAFTDSDYSNISFEEFKNDPVAAKIITLLYAQSEKERKALLEEVVDLKSKVRYYKSSLSSNLVFAIVSIIGTIVVGIGISLEVNWALIILGGILTLVGDFTPLLNNKKGVNN